MRHLPPPFQPLFSPGKPLGWRVIPPRKVNRRASDGSSIMPQHENDGDTIQHIQTTLSVLILHHLSPLVSISSILPHVACPALLMLLFNQFISLMHH